VLVGAFVPAWGVYPRTRGEKLHSDGSGRTCSMPGRRWRGRQRVSLAQDGMWEGLRSQANTHHSLLPGDGPRKRGRRHYKTCRALSLSRLFRAAAEAGGRRRQTTGRILLYGRARMTCCSATGLTARLEGSRTNNTGRKDNYKTRLSEVRRESSLFSDLPGQASGAVNSAR